MAFVIVRGDGPQFEQIVMCELLIPDTLNTYGDVYTRESIKEFVYAYAQTPDYKLNVNHDGIDVRGKDWVIVESFIARAGDPTFIEGSWVIAAKILSDELWQDILDGKINGFSFEADTIMQPVLAQTLANRQVSGTTEPHPLDGHTHDYLVLLDPLNRPISGGTGVTNGHSHRIVRHTVTEFSAGLLGGDHNHRYQVIMRPVEEPNAAEEA